MARDRVGKKISKLRHEGIPERQSVAMALSMKRAGRLTKSGGYRRVGRKRMRGVRKYSRSRRTR